MAGVPASAGETVNRTHPQASEVYEAYFVPAMFGAWAAALVDVAAPRRGDRVLDVACGTGIVARTAAPRVGIEGSVVAVDMNPAMLAVGSNLPVPEGAAIVWREGNALALPADERSIDIALCQHGLTFFPDRQAAVGEMRRVLAPGGRSLTMVLQDLGLHPVFDALMRSVSKHLEVPLDVVSIPFALPEAEELAALHTDAGFADVEIRTVSITARFSDPYRFVPMAVVSSAAAVPAFALLDDPHKASLMESIAHDCASVVGAHIREGFVVFGMDAHVAIARG